MDADPNHFAKDKVHQFIQYDYNDHTCDPFHARNIVDQLNNLDLDIDGCLTVWEDCVPLTANICKIMGLTGKLSTTGDITSVKGSDHLAHAQSIITTWAASSEKVPSNMRRIPDSDSSHASAKSHPGPSCSKRR